MTRVNNMENQISSISRQKNDIICEFTLKLAFIIMITKTLLSVSTIFQYNNTIDNFLTAAAVLLFVIRIFLQRYSLLNLLTYLLISLIVLYSCFKSGVSSLLITVLTCFAIKDENIDDIINLLFKYELIFFLFHTILAILFSFVTDNHIFVHYENGSFLLLGFGHKNLLSIYVFNLVLMYIYLNFNKLNKIRIFTFVSIGLMMYMLTKTKTSLIDTIVAAVLLLIIMKYKKIASFITNYLASFLFPLIFGCTLWFVKQYTLQTSLALSVDKFLTSRIRLGAYAYNKYGTSLLGQPVSQKAEWDAFYGLNSFTFDNIYTFIAVNQGIIWMFIISILVFILIKRKNTKINFCMIIWILYGITEVHGLNCYIFFPIILFADLFNSQRKFLSSEQKSVDDDGNFNDMNEYIR